GKARAIGWDDPNAILNDCDLVRFRIEFSERFVEAKDIIPDEHALVALFRNQGEHLLDRQLIRKRQIESDQRFAAVFRALGDIGPNCLRRILANPLTALPAMEMRKARP